MPEINFSAIEFDPNKLKEALEKAGLTQAEFSKALGYKHPNLLNRILKRKRAATASDLLKFAIALDKDPKDFCLKS